MFESFEVSLQSSKRSVIMTILLANQHPNLPLVDTITDNEGGKATFVTHVTEFKTASLPYALLRSRSHSSLLSSRAGKLAGAGRDN